MRHLCSILIFLKILRIHYYRTEGVKDKLNLERPKIANLIAHTASAGSGIGGNHYKQNTPSGHTISQPTISGQRDLQ